MYVMFMYRKDPNNLTNLRPMLLLISRTKEPAKVGTCACDGRALQQLALNVHVKHSDLLQ